MYSIRQGKARQPLRTNKHKKDDTKMIDVCRLIEQGATPTEEETTEIMNKVSKMYESISGAEMFIVMNAISNNVVNLTDGSDKYYDSLLTAYCIGRINGGIYAKQKHGKNKAKTSI